MIQIKVRAQKYILPAGIASLIVFVMSHVPKMGVDFWLLYPAGRAIWNLQNPYIVAHGFFSPPWLLVILAPVALLEFQIARWVWFALGVLCYLIAFKRLGLTSWAIMYLMLSPFFYYDLGIGNYEWLILLGATLPASIGSWIVILKPQASIILFGMWLKQRRWKVIIPVVTLAVLISLRVYPLPNQSELPWSADVWPYGIPIGIVLAWFAIKQDDTLLALAAAPFLSPYVGLQTWIMVLLPLTRNKIGLIVGILVSWVCMFLFIT